MPLKRVTYAPDVIQARRGLRISGPKTFKYPGDIEQQPHGFVMNFFNYSLTRQQTPVTLSSGPQSAAQLSGIIVLPVPVNIVENYGINTSQQDLGIIPGNIIDEFRGGGGSYENLMLNRNIMNWPLMWGAGITAILPAILGTLLDKVPGGVGTALARPLGIPQIPNAVSLGAGKLLNPHTNLILEGVKLRLHEFEWNFNPSTKEDHYNLERIIAFIRKAMLPIRANNRVFLDYPDEVEFGIFGHENIPGVSFDLPVMPCLITKFTVDRTGGKTPVFFKDTGGPAFYQLRISLTEVVPMYRDDLQETPLNPPT